jgi:hypothetical protein
MRKRRSFLVFLILLFCSLLARAQVTLDSERLFAPSLGQKFYEIAYELADSEDINGPEIEQAVVFLTAALDLDSRANYVHPVLIKLVAGRHPARDYRETVYNSLEKYLDKSTDVEPARQAVQYLLEGFNVREQREQLLIYVLQNLGGRNACFDSELSTLLGLLMAEKADANSAQYFMQAFNNNKYNKLAFEKLVELIPEQIPPALYLGHLRLALGENPLDLEAALTFARYAERIQLYETAADAYEYCTQLFSFLYPSQPLPSDIYIPWMLSNYNTQRNQHNCLQIASQLRQSGRFDLLAEAIAGKAAIKIGDTEQANQIFRAVEEEIDSQSSMDNQSVAWFYCFASPDANKALHWANKAYSTEPNSAAAASLLAYALVMNEQMDWAKLIIEKYERNQIAGLALAQIQLADANRDSAVETLKSAIARAPGSLEAERAKEILTHIGGEYIPPLDTDIILSALRNTFAQTLVPVFTEPNKIISAQLSLRSSEFPYGSSLEGTVAITNNSSEPLVVSDDGLFTGHLRVDANITGDLNKNIPNLASIKIRPASPIETGKSFFIPLHLFTAELRQLLLTHPQASVNIEFTLYLDPVTTDQGQPVVSLPALSLPKGSNPVISRIPGFKPVAVTVKRPGIEINERFLQNRLGSLTKGQQGQKIQTAHLFIGLLMEQHALANRQPPYKFTYADWMPAVLKSALLHNLNYDDDWVAKVHAMADMTSGVSHPQADLPLDYQFINALSENLNDTHWPTRMMAMYLLAKNQGRSFNKVLDWAARFDSNEFVRDMAVALGGTPPPPPQEQPAQPTQAGAQQQPPQQLSPQQ